MPINIYKNRIERILMQSITSNVETHLSSIILVRQWLWCEKALNKIDASTYLYLADKVVDEVAEKIIETL